MSMNPDALSTMFLPCSAVLFDCDGVLVDSEAMVNQCWRQWALAMHLDPDEVLGYIHGHRSIDIIEHYMEPHVRASSLQMIDALELENTAATTAIPGARDLLPSMPPDQWATVTSGSRALASARLRAAELPIPKILVASGDVNRGKPDPEGYLAGARLLGVPIDACVILEDSLTGIHAARAAGAGYVIQIGNTDPGEHQPTVAVADLRSVRWVGNGLEVTLD